MKPIDTQAALIQWGIELETRIPDNSGIGVGGYHNGLPVRTGLTQATSLPRSAPTFNGGKPSATAPSAATRRRSPANSSRPSSTVTQAWST